MTITTLKNTRTKRVGRSKEDQKMKAMAKNLVGLNYDDIDEQKDENMIKR